MFDGRNFLNLAGELASRADDEASLRTAISRAYYAAFWVARAAYRPDAPSAPHGKLWSRLRQAPGIEERRIGVAGDRLYGM